MKGVSCYLPGFVLSCFCWCKHCGESWQPHNREPTAWKSCTPMNEKGSSVEHVYIAQDISVEISAKIKWLRLSSENLIAAKVNWNHPENISTGTLFFFFPFFFLNKKHWFLLWLWAPLLDKHWTAWKPKIVSSHGKPDRTRSGCLMRKGSHGCPRGWQAGRQAKETETVAALSVACPHGIRLPETRRCRRPSGAGAEDGVPA